MESIVRVLRCKSIGLVLAFGLTVGVGISSPSVSIEDGNVVLTDSGSRKTVTHLHLDSEPVLSPDHLEVLVTRANPGDDDQSCENNVKNREALWLVDLTSGTERKIISSRTGHAPGTQVCGFGEKQFSPDGERLYFSTPGWATSGALWVYDFKRAKAKYLLPSNGFHVLADCKDASFRDKIVVSQHRYFAFGGSFDWYWLYGRDGRTELGPVGEGLDAVNAACDMHLE